MSDTIEERVDDSALGQLPPAIPRPVPVNSRPDGNVTLLASRLAAWWTSAPALSGTDYRTTCANIADGVRQLALLVAASRHRPTRAFPTIDVTSLNLPEALRRIVARRADSIAPETVARIESQVSAAAQQDAEQSAQIERRAKKGAPRPSQRVAFNEFHAFQMRGFHRKKENVT
jgi:hypothetical protein